MLACGSREYFLKDTLRDQIEGSVSMTFATKHEDLSDVPFLCKKKKNEEVQACNPSPWEAEIDRSLQILEVG